MQLNSLQRVNKNKNEKRVARGGKRGKTSGRGTKGQKARAGHRIRPELRDTIKKFPKLRGYKNKSFEVKPQPVNLTILERAFSSGDAVNPATLLEKKCITKVGGKMPKVKILATGALSKKLTVTGCLFSGTAKKSIESAGGTIA